MPIYSWSNLHVLTWGTRPSAAIGENPESARASKEAAEKIKEKDDTALSMFRSRVLFAWIACNWLLAQALSESAGLASATHVTYTSAALLTYGYVLGSLTVFTLGTRLLGSFAFAVVEAAHGARRLACVGGAKY